MSKQPSQREGKGLRPLLRSVAALGSRTAPLENITNFQMMCVITFCLPYDVWRQRDIDYLKGKLEKFLKVLTTQKATIFSFSFMFATLHALAPPQVLDFTFSKTFLSSLDYSSPLRFQLAACINTLSFFLLYRSTTMLHKSQTTPESHSDFRLQLMTISTFNISSLSALHFDLTFASCWPIEFILLLLNKVAFLSANPAIWNRLLLMFQQITCF